MLKVKMTTTKKKQILASTDITWSLNKLEGINISYVSEGHLEFSIDKYIILIYFLKLSPGRLQGPCGMLGV